MHQRFVFIIFLGLSLSSCLSSAAQDNQTKKIPLINSSALIAEGKALYDSGKYKESALKLLSVPKRDTNYVFMLSELALTYNADSLYDKAIDASNEGLKYSTAFRAHFLRTKAIALDKKGSYNESVKAFNEAIAKYPFNHSLIFNLGITYYNHKEYDKAEECFFRVLAINPFHSLSHLNLANLAIGNRNRTHAIMAMGAYLSLSNSDNSRLVFLNKFLGNELSEEPTISLTGPNACEKLDQLIRSGIALDKQFKSKIPVEASVVKQLELFLSQLSLLPLSSDDRWVNYYLPMYSSYLEKNLSEPFLYHVLSSAANENVKKWTKKNEKLLKEFYIAANAAFAKHHLVVKAPESFGYKEPVQAWFFPSHQIEALGNKSPEGKRQGPWRFFHSSYELSAEGAFSPQGEKIGTWKYYYDNGNIKSEQNNDTGEIVFFYKDGGKEDHYFLVNSEIEGNVDSYFQCGSLKEKMVYKKGTRDGKGETYFVSGQKSAAFNYKSGELDGEYIAFHSNGKSQFKKQFTNGLANGPFQEFHSNGKLLSEGAFLNGEQNGLWKYFYYNGQLERSGNFNLGKGSGEWVYYEHDGTLSEKRNFNEKGQLHGESVSYYMGKVYLVNTYKNDLLVKAVYTDQTGKELGKFENGSGNFSTKTFFATGLLAGEGAYKKGEMDGLWTYYFPDGIKRKEYKYQSGLIQGEALEYFKTGGKKFVTNYKDNEYHGYFQEFHKNGQIKREGWYQNGQRQQQWLTYYSDGTLESDYYYLNDEFVGPTYDYNEVGKLSSVSTYRDGLVEDIADYNSSGVDATIEKSDGPKKIYTTKFPSGKTKSSYEVVCGVYHGRLSQYFPNDKVFYAYDWSNGRKSGTYQYMTTDNIASWSGQWVDGNEFGIWTDKNSIGRLESQGKFYNGQYDSIWNYYYISGKTASRASYKYGEREGITDFFAPDGKAILQKQYEGGLLVSYRVAVNGLLGEWMPVKKEMTITANYPNGTKAYEESFTGGLVNGPKRIYYSDGKIYSEYNFIDGDYNGKYVINHPNGKAAETGEYKNDGLVGIRKYFMENGTLLKSEEFANGVRHGKTTSYVNGVIKNEVSFWGGSPEK